MNKNLEIILTIVGALAFFAFILWVAKKFAESQTPITDTGTGTGERVPYIIEQGFVQQPQQQFVSRAPVSQQGQMPSRGANIGARVQGGQVSK